MTLSKTLKQKILVTIAMSAICMFPLPTNAGGSNGITSGGTIDTPLDISIAGNSSDDSGILLFKNDNLIINNGGKIYINSEANASGISAADNFYGAANVTVNGKKLIIDVGMAKHGASVTGIWSQTLKNMLGTGNQPQPDYQGGKIILNSNENQITVTSYREGYGLLSGSDFGNNSNGGGNIICNGKLDINVNILTPEGKNSDPYYRNRGCGIIAYNGNIYLNNDTNINVTSQANGQDGKDVTGLFTGYDGHIKAAKNSTIDITSTGIATVTGITNGTYDFFLEAAKKTYTPSSIQLGGTTNIYLNGKSNHGIRSAIKASLEADTLNINFADSDTNKLSTAIHAHDESKIDINNLYIGTNNTALTDASKITALSTSKLYAGYYNIAEHPIITVNQAETGTVQINGSIENEDNGSIDLHLTNANSYLYGNIDTAYDMARQGNETNLTLKNGALWKNFSTNGWNDSNLTNLVLDNNAHLDMTYNQYSNDNPFQNIYIANSMSGTNATINMDIDAGTNINNSDRLYIAGTHTGEHFITLNNVNAEGKTDGANGTVLVSVNNEQGKFSANDHEGSLYWKRYILDKKASTTAGYNTDWYLKEVQVIPATPLEPATPSEPSTPLIPANPRPTTSVAAVHAAQELGFACWIEDNKLMQRMGDLRQKTGNDAGIWVRSKGGKFSNADFSNRYTAYQLGYDAIAKRTAKLTRYQGVAFAYNDAHSSFTRGSGKNKAKSIAFYSTDMRKNGHYLDLGFKIYNADNDFTVYDTLGKKITGSYDNTGISLNVEYGRKKLLDHRWSIEPQAQLTFGFLGGANYTTSNNIHVSEKDATTALGRIGCNFIYDMDKKTNLYFKANWLHQFAGSYGATLDNGDESLRINSHNHDTWLEYGLGIACLTGKNNHFYTDIERSSGGSLDKDWQWNVGMIWSF